jgi:hypothetical protein
MGYEKQAVRGVVNYYGSRLNKGQYFGAEGTTKGDTKEAFWTFDSDNFPAAGTNGIQLEIPKGALLKAARLEVLEAFTGGTSLVIGFAEGDGTAIDADGVLESVLTAALIKGADIAGNGALIGDRLPEAGELVVTPTGTFTGGKARLVLEYSLEAPQGPIDTLQNV